MSSANSASKPVRTRALRPGVSRTLELDEVLEAMIEDGLCDQDGANKVRYTRSQLARTASKVELHPLVLVANTKLPSPEEPTKPLTLEVLSNWLGKRLGMRCVKIDPTKVDVARLTQVISAQYAQRYAILPIEASAERVVFATTEPLQTQWLDDLRQILRREIERVVANPLDIARFTTEFYRVSRSVQRAVDESIGGNRVASVLNFEQLLELGKLDVAADDHHIVQIVDWLLQYAYEQRASDIHLEPRRDMSPVRFRIDGAMQEVYKLPTTVMTATVSRIKVLSRLDVAEKRRPQDGRLKTVLPNGKETELRISVMPTAFGEKCVMRIFDPDIVVKGFDQLGFSGREGALWKQMIEQPHGIVLITGPTGSGKTTTLYSTLKLLATPDVNICTIEDPIEMVQGELNQMQVQPQLDLDFAAGIRTLLRQDPDIIMVGEIRDLETAKMAIQASLTGHLVLSTLHTNDAPSALTRLMDLGVPHYLLQGTIIGLMAQRLARTLCPHCKTDGTGNLELWRTLVHPFPLELPARVKAPVGCLECRKTGYLGRTGIYELIAMTPALREMIAPSMVMPAFVEQARKDGYRPLRLGAAQHIVRGLTTIEEALKVVPVTDATG